MPEFTDVTEAIKETEEKKLRSIAISFPESMSQSERLEQVTTLSDFLENNRSLQTVDFSNTFPINGGIPTLSEQEADILADGLKKNSSITNLIVANVEEYNKATKEEPIPQIS